MDDIYNLVFSLNTEEFFCLIFRFITQHETFDIQDVELHLAIITLKILCCNLSVFRPWLYSNSFIHQVPRLTSD